MLSTIGICSNVIAHKLGHAIKLGHNDDPSNLMCGRPAPCRADAFRSDVELFPSDGRREAISPKALSTG